MKILQEVIRKNNSWNYKIAKRCKYLFILIVTKLSMDLNIMIYRKIPYAFYAKKRALY